MKEVHKAKKGCYFGYIFRREPLLDCHNFIGQDIDTVSIYLMTQKHGLRSEERTFPQFQEQVELA